MKILFHTTGKRIQLIASEELIFNIDGKYINTSGAEISAEDVIKRNESDDEWYESWMEYGFNFYP